MRVRFLVLLVLFLHGPSARADPLGAAPAVDEPTHQLFDLSKEAGKPAFVLLELPKGQWRCEDHTPWGRPRTTLARGAQFRRVPTADGPMENGGFTVQFEARGDRALKDVADTVYDAWLKAGHKPAGKPVEPKRRKLKLGGKTLEAVFRQWEGTHALTGRDILTTMVVCAAGDAVLVLSGWDLVLESSPRTRRMRRGGRFSPTGTFDALVRATAFSDRRPKPKAGRFKLSDSITHGRYYMTACLPPEFEQGGGPFPAGTAACAERRDENGKLAARFRVFFRPLAHGNLEAEARYVWDFIRERHEQVEEPREIKVGGFPAFLLGFRDRRETAELPPHEARVVVFIADGRVCTWSFLSARAGDDLAKDLACFEKTILKSAHIWWRRRKD